MTRTQTLARVAGVPPTFDARLAGAVAILLLAELPAAAARPTSPERFRQANRSSCTRWRSSRSTGVHWIDDTTSPLRNYLADPHPGRS